jgi:hypothetical protein
MKYWKYTVCNKINIGTKENPNWHESFYKKMIPATEANEEIAKTEAYNGEYTIEDDGQPETYQPTESERLEALEAAMLEMMGVAL